MNHPHADELLLFASGVTLMIVVSCLMSLVQLIAPNELRGRVMSIYLVAFRGGMPVGSLVSGYFASVSSAPRAIDTMPRSCGVELNSGCSLRT